MLVIFLYSNFDDLMIYNFILIVVFMLLLDKAFKHLKDKISRRSISVLNEKENLETYILDFKNKDIQVKKISFVYKLVLIIICLLVVFIPFYEFFETLNPKRYLNSDIINCFGSKF